MGQTQTIQKIGFEDIQISIKNPETYLLINTLPENMQDCLIYSTVPISQEEILINKLLTTNRSIKIIIYGKNNTDETIYNKQTQLLTLGFSNIYLYIGGLFEWLLLQDIFGTDMFHTTKKINDILIYKPSSVFNVKMILN